MYWTTCTVIIIHFWYSMFFWCSIKTLCIQKSFEPSICSSVGHWLYYTTLALLILLLIRLELLWLRCCKKILTLSFRLVEFNTLSNCKIQFHVNSLENIIELAEIANIHILEKWFPIYLLWSERQMNILLQDKMIPHWPTRSLFIFTEK